MPIITNINGDVDSLFKTYDQIIKEFKNKLKNYIIKKWACQKSGLHSNIL